MKKNRKLLLPLLIFFTIIFFVGCSYSVPYKFKLSRYNINSNLQQNQVIDLEEFQTLDIDQRKMLIAEKYASISFTISTYKITEVIKSNNTTITEEEKSFGSGFIVRSGGYILTNDHVINESKKESTTSTTGGVTTNISYKIYVSQDGGKTDYEATLLWSSQRFDMAILICEKFANLEAAVLKDRTIYCDESEKIKVLEEVIAIGTPISKNYYASATIGNISSSDLRLSVAFGGNFYEHLIQHAAPINHGSSGGPLIDLNGNVIGLNTLGHDSANLLFFSVSIYPAIAILDKVVENYSLGETTEDIIFGFKGTDKCMLANSDDPVVNFTKDGVYVLEVEENCIIEDLREKDIIIKGDITINGETLSFEIKDQNMLLYFRIWLLYSPQEVKIKVLRNGVQTVLNINLGV